MTLPGPIVLIDDDKDDQEILLETLFELGIKENVRLFDSCIHALEYLKTTTERPFIILCDVNLPVMDGLEFRKILNENEYLRKKSIPFVFLSTTAMQEQVHAAYDLTVQGFFLKQMSMAAMQQMLTRILSYWIDCAHPNSEKDKTV